MLVSMTPLSNLDAPHRGRNRPRANSTTSGILFGLTATPWGIVYSGLSIDSPVPPWLRISALLICMSFLIAGLLITSRVQLGRIFGTLAIVGTAAIAVPHLTADPLLSLLSLLVGASALVLLWKLGAPLIELSQVRRRALREGQAQGAAMVALALWLAWTFSDRKHSELDSIVVGWAVLCAGLTSLDWAITARKRHPVGSGLLFLVAVACGWATPLLWGRPWGMVTTWTGLATLAAVVIRPSPTSAIEQSSWWEPFIGNPQRLLIGTFAALCLGGTFLLALPLSAASAPLHLVDALFTATSAVCVTGLIVVDTPVALSGFGQGVVFLLIQIGGLGIMTFSTVAIWLLGRRMSLRHEGAVARLISTQDRGRLFATASRILLLTLTCEGLGALVLTLAFFFHGDQLPMALWRGVFTSVSAFCNAGFALQSDSLIPYQTSPLILHTVSALVIAGGLSPMVVFSVPSLLIFTSKPVSAQARMALLATLLLLVLGFLGILAFEWNDSLAGLTPNLKLHNAWFQSVSLRTAGFNSVDISVVRPATLTLMLLWMFIGEILAAQQAALKQQHFSSSFSPSSRRSADNGRWRFLESTFRKERERERQ